MKIKHLLILVLVFGLFIGVLWNANRLRVLASSLSPFVVTEVTTTQTAGEPNSGTSSTMQFAVRADGSSVKIATTSTGEHRSIVDFQKGVSINVALGIQAVSTMKISRQKPYTLASHCVSDATASQLVERGVADGQILGYAVDRSAFEIQVPAGNFGPEPHRITITEWRAPVLGCLVMRRNSVTEKSVNGSWVADSSAVEQVISVAQRNVDNYFAVPASYTEMASGDLQLKLHPGTDPVRIKKYNDYYYANRP